MNVGPSSQVKRNEEMWGRGMIIVWTQILAGSISLNDGSIDAESSGAGETYTLTGMYTKTPMRGREWISSMKQVRQAPFDWVWLAWGARGEHM